METRCAVGHPAVAGRRFSIGKRVEVVPSVFFVSYNSCAPFFVGFLFLSLSVNG